MSQAQLNKNIRMLSRSQVIGQTCLIITLILFAFIFLFSEPIFFWLGLYIGMFNVVQSIYVIIKTKIVLKAG